jgi:hypothetical protein
MTERVAFWRCTSTVDGARCQRIRWHRGWHRHSKGSTHRTWGPHADRRETYETTAPWVTWTWLSVDRETRITGRSRMLLTCCICGKKEIVRIRIPRFGPVPEPPNGIHPERLRAIERHAHPSQRNPSDWALPLRNAGAWPGGVPFSLFENVARTAQMEVEEEGNGN